FPPRGVAARQRRAGVRVLRNSISSNSCIRRMPPTPTLAPHVRPNRLPPRFRLALDRHRRRPDFRPLAWRGAAGAAASWLWRDQYRLAQNRAGAGAALHRRRDGFARLWLVGGAG